jgi:hypothetical protein
VDIDERVGMALKSYAATIEFERPPWAEIVKRASRGPQHSDDTTTDLDDSR